MIPPGVSTSAYARMSVCVSVSVFAQSKGINLQLILCCPGKLAALLIIWKRDRFVIIGMSRGSMRLYHMNGPENKGPERP